MKIAITGEGSTDFGKKDYHTGEWLPGPAVVYAENIAEEQGMEIEILPIEKAEVKKVKLQRTRGLQGRGVPARKFMVQMSKHDCEAGIYYCDADKESGIKGNDKQAVDKHYDKVYKEVKEGLNSDKAIPMIPLSMIECWLLGDKKALEQVYEISINQNQMPARPEYIWGAKVDRNSNYPKNYFVRLIQNTGKRYRTYEPDREDFHEIAKCSEISTLREKCPRSYEQFYFDFVELLKNFKLRNMR